MVMKSLAHISALLLSIGSCSFAELQRFDYNEKHMGVDVRILLFSDNAEQAKQASRAAFDRIEAINQVCSDYLVSSEVSKLSQTHDSWVDVSDDLWKVISYAQSLSEKTRGAFDITGGRLSIEWRQARFTNKLPGNISLKNALNTVSYKHLELDKKNKRVKLKQQGMRIDLGALAKGYAADEALKQLSAQGIQYVLIDASGDMAMSAHPQGAWKIFINNKNRATNAPFLRLSNCAIASSGAALQHLKNGEEVYSHIYDPLNGKALTHNLQATIIAKSCMEADALATASSVLGPQKGLTLLENETQVEGYFLNNDEKLFTPAFPPLAFRN